MDMGDRELDYIMESWMETLDPERGTLGVEDPAQRFGNFVYNFERLDVWRRAMDLTTQVYQITARFPDSERFGLTSQLRRACVSVPSNLAEGVNRRTEKDKVRLLNIAYGSLMEALTQILLAHRLSFISDDEYSSIRQQIEIISAMTHKLCLSFSD
jgi:four helix bundle protein